jgi:hypothetical protein
MIYSVYIYIVNIRGSNAQKKKKHGWTWSCCGFFLSMDLSMDDHPVRTWFDACTDSWEMEPANTRIESALEIHL